MDAPGGMRWWSFELGGRGWVSLYCLQRVGVQPWVNQTSRSTVVVIGGRCRSTPDRLPGVQRDPRRTAPRLLAGHGRHARRSTTAWWCHRTGAATATSWAARPSSSSTARCGWRRPMVACSGWEAGRTSSATRCRSGSNPPESDRTGLASSAIRATPSGSASSPGDSTPQVRTSPCRWCSRAACRSAPSATFSGYADHRIAHALDLDEVRWLIREYGESAAIADRCRRRRDRDPRQPRRRRPVVPLTGHQPARRRVRRQLRQPASVPSRDRRDDPVAGAAAVHVRPATEPRREHRGRLRHRRLPADRRGVHRRRHGRLLQLRRRQQLGRSELHPDPVVRRHRLGRVVRPGQAGDEPPRRVRRSRHVGGTGRASARRGHADLVAMARATMADPAVVNKARGLVVEPVRPCIGLNECIHRKQVEGLAYACGVNPTFAREAELRGRPTRTSRPRDRCSSSVPARVVPSSRRCAPSRATRASLGAQPAHRRRTRRRRAARVATPSTGGGSTTRRTASTGSASTCSSDATATVDDVLDGRRRRGAVATGATPRMPPIPGVDGRPRAHRSGRAARSGRARPPRRRDRRGRRSGAAVGLRPPRRARPRGHAGLPVDRALTARGQVLQRGHARPARRRRCQFVPMARVVGDPRWRAAARVDVRRPSLVARRRSTRWCSWPERSPNDRLYRELKRRHPAVHLLGDAFAPRRMVFATRQAFELAQTLL